jgi:hypothetical protein
MRTSGDWIVIVVAREGETVAIRCSQTRMVVFEVG